MRKGKAGSWLKGPVKSIKRLKPQLPYTGGPFTKVRFFSLETVNGEAQVVETGAIVLKEGQLVAEPADSLALQNVLSERMYLYRMDVKPEESERVQIDPQTDPETWLKACRQTYSHGSYCWCEPVED